MDVLIALPNPFRSSVVSDPWLSPESDVQSIHQTAFTRCCEALLAARSQQRATSVLLHGEAGSGKTHLLARLRAHLIAEADGPGGPQEAVFISIRMQTSPRMIWRHLLRRMVEDLLRRDGNSLAQIERLLLHRLGESGLAIGDGRRWLTQKRGESQNQNLLRHLIEPFFDRIDDAGRISYPLRIVLGNLLLGQHRGLASAWLRGESLPETELEKLGLTGEAETDEDLEERAFRTVIALASLATSEAPIIFCFDQIEAMQLDGYDNSGLLAFGQMMSTLHAETRHVLLISCIQSAFLETFHRTVRKSDLARIGEYAESSLNPLTWTEGVQMVKSRMDKSPALKALRAAKRDLCWPLDEIEIKTVFTPTGCTARRLLSHCAELFESIRLGEGEPSDQPAPPLSHFLDQEFEIRKKKSIEANEPCLTDQILDHGLPLLVQLLRRNWRRSQHRPPPGLDMIFEGPHGRIGVSLCNSQHHPTLSTKLESLIDPIRDKIVDKLFLLRDSRLPLSSRANVNRARREQLLEQGALWIEPSVDSLAALDALRQLLSDANSGELDNRGQCIGRRAVQDWLLSNLSSHLNDLLEQMLPADSEPAAFSELLEELRELLDRHSLISISDAAAMLAREELEIRERLESQTDRIGVLGEPPAIMFRLVPGNPMH
jgi:hypothetical protein